MGVLQGDHLPPIEEKPGMTPRIISDAVVPVEFWYQLTVAAAAVRLHKRRFHSENMSGVHISLLHRISHEAMVQYGTNLERCNP